MIKKILIAFLPFLFGAALFAQGGGPGILPPASPTAANIAAALNGGTLTASYTQTGDLTLNGSLAQAGSLGTETLSKGDGTGSCAVDWTCGAGWTIGGGVFTRAATVGTLDLVAIPTTAIVAGTWYKLVFDVPTLTASTVTPSAGGWTGAPITASGTAFTAYFYATATTALTFSATNTTAGTMDNISLKPISGLATFTTTAPFTSVLAGQNRWYGSSAASSPMGWFSGSWFTGGSATTTKPHVLIEPSNVSSGAWSTAGTGLGINAASGFAGNLIDAQVAGASKFSVTSAGVVTGASSSTANYFSATGASGFVNSPYAQYASSINARSAFEILWSSDTSYAGTKDVGLSRASAGVMKVTNGSTGYGNIAIAPLTTATMTAGIAGQLRSNISSYSWTNAMVVAGADVKVCTLPAKTIIKNMYIVINTAGTNMGAATLTVAVGRTGAAYVDYIAAGDALAAANTVYGDAAGERGANLTGYDLPSYTGTTDVYAHFATDGAGGKTLADVLTSTGTVVIESELLP